MPRVLRSNSVSLKIVLPVLIVILCYGQCEKIDFPCKTSESIVISNGVVNKFNKNIVHNGVTYTPDSYFLINKTFYGCVCLKSFCARKCCESGYHYDEDSKCVKNIGNFRDQTIDVDDGVVKEEKSLLRDFTHFGLDCSARVKFKLDPELEQYSLQSHGELRVDTDGGSYDLKLEEYCLEVAVDQYNHQEVVAFECSEEDSEIDGEYGAIVTGEANQI